MTTFLIVLVVVAIGIILAVTLSKRKPAQQQTQQPAAQQTFGNDDATASSTAQKTQQGFDVTAAILLLTQINLKLRCDHLADHDVVAIIERIIDALGQLLPVCTEQHPGAEMTHTVQRTAQVYLPDTLAKYWAMSKADRAAGKERFVTTMQKILEKFSQYKKAIEENAVRQFEVEGNFLEGKFSAALSI